MLKTGISLRNERGFTLAELLVVLSIMTFLTLAVCSITINTVKVMMMGTRQNIAQSSVEFVINKIAEDIRQAGSDDLRHILGGSSQTAIAFRRYMQNLDTYSPSNDDMNFDIGCYRFVRPSGSNPYSPGYRPGYISGGTGNGETSVCSNMYKLTDSYADVRRFSIEFCRPDNSIDGAYDCSLTSINNGNVGNYLDDDNKGVDISQTAICVWMVRISVEYSRRYVKKGDTISPDLYNNTTSSYQTAVTLRNPYLMSLFKDEDGDDQIDCCDTSNGMTDAQWCPPKRSY